jgi:poly-gamma-glutamate synthesis protein (capsule biosynthesis protein)
LNPGWTGDGQSVTLGFGGDVHFEGTVGENLAADPSTALGTTIPQLFAGTSVSMVNLESVVTDGTCPEPQNKQYIFDAPASAVTALKSARISLVTEANDHGYDCGAEGLSQNLTIATQDAYPMIGIGNNAAQAFTPFRATVDGQRIAIIAATQVIDSNLVSTWTATGTQPGVASAIDPTALVSEVQQVRKTADTVIVFLHWGTETQSCPNPQQEPLAQQLVKAGADIVVGSNSHVLSGAGYLGSAYVDYGLGNFAFYDTNPPETDSGSLIVTAEGRRITSAVFRPATIVAGLPQPLTGQAATSAVQSWNSARSCTNLSAIPSKSVATLSGETKAFVAPPTTTTTSSATGVSGGTGSAATTTTTISPATTTTTRAGSTTTTKPSSTTTSPTDNAGG